MAGFDDVVKYLDFKPARKATLVEAQNSLIPFDKYYTLDQSRPIQRVSPYFTLAPQANAYLLTTPFMAFQYNITMPENFYILTTTNRYAISSVGTVYPQAFIVSGMTCVRSTLNGVTTRYILDGSNNVFFQQTPVYDLQKYTNQLIAKDCVIEFWWMGNAGHSPPPLLGGISGVYNIFISILNDPVDANDEGQFLGVINPIIRYTQGVSMPVSNPFNNSLFAYLQD